VSQHERRRHPRYSLRLTIKLRRGGEELSAEVINASAGGCLLITSVSMEPGEVLEVEIPELKLPQARLHVLRSYWTPSGYMVATCFDTLLADETSIRRLSDEQQSGSQPRLLN
jgi:hypothetical protein